MIKAKVSVENFDVLKEEYLVEIKQVIETDEIPADLIINFDDDEKDPMVRKVEKDEEAELYKNYTIQLLHGPRQNEK